MKKLTKDQKYYRKLKKDGKKDFRFTDKAEKGKFWRHVRVTRKALSVRVKPINQLKEMTTFLLSYTTK